VGAGEGAGGVGGEVEAIRGEGAGVGAVVAGYRQGVDRAERGQRATAVDVEVGAGCGRVRGDRVVGQGRAAGRGLVDASPESPRGRAAGSRGVPVDGGQLDGQRAVIPYPGPIGVVVEGRARRRRVVAGDRAGGDVQRAEVADPGGGGGGVVGA